MKISHKTCNLREVREDVGFSPTMSGVRYLIREYEPADFEVLWRLDQACFPPGIAYSRRELMTYISRRSAFTLIAQRADESGRVLHTSDMVDGFITADLLRTRRGHIITIDVDARARRSGVGSLLMGSTETRLLQAGCREVRLETAVDNVGALAFYKRHGYFLTKTEPHYYANGLDAFVLVKSLRPTERSQELAGSGETRNHAKGDNWSQ